MWQTITFKFNGDIEAARARRDKWIARHQSSCQIIEIFVNNAFGLEYRKLRIIG